MIVPGEFVAFAGLLADASGQILRKWFRQPVAIEIKSDQSPVTAIDKEVESRLRDMIETHYPHHGVVGEEFGAVRPDAEYVWVLDPIDGTKSFVTGRPLFGTLIALCRDGHPVLGVIDHPSLGTGERWVGASGHPTWHNGVVARVRSCANLSVAAMFGSSPHSSDAANERAFDRVRRAVRQVLYSSDCYAYGLIASGYADLCIEFGLGIHDYLAAVPIIEGAGGFVSSWTGAPLTLASGKNVIAAGDRQLHGKVVAMLAASDIARPTH